MAKAYNLSFKMYMEGVEVPFSSANIVCTPMGAEANINVPSNLEILSLKPKTAIQIFFFDWLDGQSWRMMFDGFFSSFYKTDEASGGRTIGLQCRDFRMDIRRAPAALAYLGDNELDAQNYYNAAGLFTTYVIKGGKSGTIKTYDSTGLVPLSQTLKMIAGTAYDSKNYKQKDGEYAYQGYDVSTSGGFYLDAIIRGLWTEAVGGTSAGNFLNKRIRLDKRFLVPKNDSGYDMWSRQTSGLELGSFMMANSRFSSLEAAIMRVAGLFSVRPYSCSTPSLIPLSESVSGKPNIALQYIIDPKVLEFLVNKRSEDFGAKYMLNETMLLPSLEFTAPPNCNIFLPPIYDRVNFQYDFDSDYTRGVFNQISFASSNSSGDLSRITHQIPTALFSINKTKKDDQGRTKPVLTLEERYKGVNVLNDSVNYELGARDASKAMLDPEMNKEHAKLLEEVTRLENELNKARGIDLSDSASDNVLTDSQAAQIKSELDKKKRELKNSRTKGKYGQVNKSLRRHALIKYMNAKFIGRVATVDMMFNPFPMCGFPGVIVTDMEAYGKMSMKSIVGTVQQVKHLIVISTEGAEASTTVLMNNVRFEDEPTDIDDMGSPLYMKATDRSSAEVYPETLEFKHDHFVGEPQSGVVKSETSKSYDISENQLDASYKYAKDFITIPKSAYSQGARNTIYVDKIYEPNHIARFYKLVFQHKHSFMVGKDGDRTFMYDTIHEALSDLRNNRPELLNDYEAAMDYVRRNICSADAFFHGILGLSSLSDNKYVNRKDGFLDNKTDKEYFGISSDAWSSSSIDGLKAANGGIMSGPGEMSSIREFVPVTAFIKERKDAVKEYLTAMENKVQSTRSKL